MRQALIGAWMGLCLSSDWTCGLHFLVWIPPSPLFGQLTSEPINPSPLGLALSLSPSLENLPLLLIHESKHIVVKYYMYLMLIVYWIFINGLSNWNSILLTSWKIGVSGNACFLGIFLLDYALIRGGWVYDGVICVGHVLAVLGPWEGDLEGGNIWMRYLE